MDDVVNRLARELSTAIANAVFHSPDVQEVHERARKLGFQMELSLEAEIGFRPVLTPAESAANQALQKVEKGWKSQGFNSTDKRLLRSLRIAADGGEE